MSTKLKNAFFMCSPWWFHSLAFVLLVIEPFCLTAAEVGERRPSEQVGPCGANCLSISARLLNAPVRFDDVLGVLPKGGTQMSLLDLKRAANDLGFHAQGADLRGVPPAPGVPTVVALRREGTSEGHFVVLYATSRHTVQLFDYPHEPRVVDIAALAAFWDGRGLYIARDAASLNVAIAEHTQDDGSLAFASALMVLLTCSWVFVCSAGTPINILRRTISRRRRLA